MAGRDQDCRARCRLQQVKQEERGSLAWRIQVQEKVCPQAGAEKGEEASCSCGQEVEVCHPGGEEGVDGEAAKEDVHLPGLQQSLPQQLCPQGSSACTQEN